MLKFILFSFLAVTVVLMSGCLSPNEHDVTISGKSAVIPGEFECYKISTGGHDSVSYDINWGDGLTCFLRTMPSNATATAKHMWLSAGNYTIDVKVTFSDNTIVHANKTIEVR